MTFSIDNPSDLLAVIPRLVGHDINDAIAIVGLQQNGAIRAMWRVGALNPLVLRRVSISLQDLNLTAVVLIGYAPVDIAAPALVDLAEHIQQLGIDDITLLVSHAGRNWDLNDPTCPADGRASVVSADFAAVLDAAYGPVAASEEAVGEVLAPVTGDARAAMVSAMAAFTARLVDDPLLLDRIDLAAIINTPDLPDPQVTAHAAVALDRSIDAFMRALELTSKHPDASQRLWIHLVRHTSADYRGAPALLIAYACVLTGRGVLGGHAIDIAESLVPHHPFTRPIAEAILSGRVPTVFREGLALIDPN